MTAKWPGGEWFSAAINPAPPPPTITASYFWYMSLVLFEPHGSGSFRRRAARSRRSCELAGVESQNGIRPERQKYKRQHVYQTERKGAPAARVDVIRDDGSQAIQPVQQRKPEHEQIVGAPKGGGITPGDKVEVNHAHVIDEVHDKQVPQRQEQQQDSRQAHEEPGIEFHAAFRSCVPR